jgi:hypothetical protein
MKNAKNKWLTRKYREDFGFKIPRSTKHMPRHSTGRCIRNLGNLAMQIRGPRAWRAQLTILKNSWRIYHAGDLK